MWPGRCPDPTSQYVVDGQRLAVEHVEACAGDPALNQCLDQRISVQEGPARGVDEERRWPHEADLVTAENASGALAEREVDRQHVAGAGELSQARGQLDPELVCSLPGEVLAPRDDVHAERCADPGHATANPPRPEDPEPTAGQLGAHGALPRAAGAKGRVLVRDMARETEDEGPGELRGRDGRAGGAAHGDAVSRGCREVDRGVAHAGGDHEAEPGKAGEQRCR